MTAMTGRGPSRSATSPQPGQVALYRFYDATESLLYVGISNDPRRRWKEHARDKAWYPQVRHQALTWYENEPLARRAEDAAIRQERPHFNIAGAVRPARARIALRPDRWILAAVAWLNVLLVLAVAAALAPVLAPVAVAAAFVTPVVTVIAFVLTTAPLIRRFGSWVERNSRWPVSERAS